VEYSTNKGDSWTLLGGTGGAWCDFANGAGGTAFPAGEPFFNATQSNYTLASRDLTFLAGNANVAFRFVFASDFTVNTAGVSIDDFEITGPNNTPLPVTLSTFNGRAVTEGNLLEWTTLSELNNDGFFVERSTDTRTFISLGFVKGNGNSTLLHRYSFTDADPLPETINYYRLRQVDFNGEQSYSKVIAVRRGQSTNKGIMVFPNPVKDNLHLLFDKYGIHRFRLRLMALNGRVLLDRNVEFDGVDYSLTIGGAEFTTGVYLLEVRENGETFSTKIMIQ
jgi:hypothetical protein